MNKYHNPQGLTLDDTDMTDGFRILTVEEAAVLTDKPAFNTPVGRTLMHTLAPQGWSQGAARWMPADPNKLLSEAVTYRTQAPFPPKHAESWTVGHPGQLEAACGDFVESFTYLAAFHHVIMVDKGFWNSEREVDAFLREAGREDLAGYVRNAFDGQKLALQTTEVSECLEAIRHGNPPDDKVPEFSGAEAELADVLLRLMDQAHARGWNVAAAMVAKMKMNATRAKMHGGKQF